MVWTPLSTLNSAKKTGICTSSGRQLETGVGAVLLVQRHGLAAHRLTRELILLALVLLLNFSQFRGDFHHLALALDLLHEERNQRRADDEDETDDRQHPGDAGGRPAARSHVKSAVPRDEHELDQPTSAARG